MRGAGLLSALALIAVVTVAYAATGAAGSGYEGRGVQSRPTLASEFGTSADLDFPPPSKSANRKLQTPLARLSAAQRDHGLRGVESLARDMVIPLEEGSVRVIAVAMPGRAMQVSGRAAELGIPVETAYQDLVQLIAPVGSLEALSQDPNVAFIRLPMPLVPAGSVTGQGVSLIGADTWHVAGITGAGAKVGILDTGFAGYEALLGTELPSSVVTHSCRVGGDITGGGNAHGTAVAEIVHEVAPDAELYLANASTIVEFANCVDWLKNQGVDIVNLSGGFSVSGPGDGTGIVNDIVSDAKSQGLLWVNAAGNEAQSHWSGPWDDPDADAFLNFLGSDETNHIIALNGEVINIALKWDDPFGTSCNDYELLLYDSSRTTLLAFSIDPQDFCTSGLPRYPVETLSYQVTATGTYHVVVVRFAADGLATFHLYSRNDFHSCPISMEYCVKSSSILQPGDNPDAFTVGAVSWISSTLIEPFSSRGPTDDGRIKPDLVAPDRVSTEALGSFAGTSASSPHAAGAAALVMQWQPGWSQEQIRSFLVTGAVDLGEAGADNVFGAGLLDLGAAPATPMPTPIATPTAMVTVTPTPSPINTPLPPPTATPAPTPIPGGGMSLNGPSTVSVGNLFTLSVSANPAPNVEIGAFGSEVLFPEELKWLQRATCADELQVGRADGGAIALCNSFIPILTGGAAHAVLSEFALPKAALDVAPGSTALLLELDFVCNTPGTYKLTLTAVPDSFDGAVFGGTDGREIRVGTIQQDYDGDSVPNDVADTVTIECVERLDSDGDGCTDEQELGPNRLLGGQRNPLDFWDFFDPNRDRSVGFQDFLQILARFGAVGDANIDPLSPPPPAPAYHTRFDRTGASPGGNPWQSGPPDGTISLRDFLALLAQFGHTCQ